MAAFLLVVVAAAEQLTAAADFAATRVPLVVKVDV